METYKNDYTKKKDETLWELHKMGAAVPVNSTLYEKE